MNVVYSAINCDLTEGMRSAIDETLVKINKLVLIDNAKVFLESMKRCLKIEVVIPLDGVVIRAKSIDNDLYCAIEDLEDKLRAQINKYLRKKPAKNPGSISTHYSTEDEEYMEEESPSHKIVRRKVFNLKPMDEEEAIMQMELLGHNSFMFFNSDLKSMCMLYKRRDGNYGMIEGHY